MAKPSTRKFDNTKNHNQTKRTNRFPSARQLKVEHCRMFASVSGTNSQAALEELEKHGMDAAYSAASFK